MADLWTTQEQFFFHVKFFLNDSSHTQGMQVCSQIRWKVMCSMGVRSKLPKNWVIYVFLLFAIILWIVKWFSLICSKKMTFKLQCSHFSSRSSEVLLLNTPDMSNDSILETDKTFKFMLIFWNDRPLSV